MNKQTAHKEKDLKAIAYLLTTDAEYKGYEIDETNTVYCLFTPYDKTVEHVNNYYAETAVPVQPKRLFASLEASRNIIFRAKDALRSKELGASYGRTNK